MSESALGTAWSRGDLERLVGPLESSRCGSNGSSAAKRGLAETEREAGSRSALCAAASHVELRLATLVYPERHVGRVRSDTPSQATGRRYGRWPIVLGQGVANLRLSVDGLAAALTRPEET
jgi:hypothetical protein